jgi:hypothetical protein
MMHRCTAEQRQDGHSAGGGVQLRLAALDVAIGAPITRSGQFRNYLRKALPALPPDEGPLWRTHYAVPEAGALSCGRRSRFHGNRRLGRQQRVLRRV